MACCADDQPPSPLGHKPQPAPSWLQDYGIQQAGDYEMLSSLEGPESDDVEMQDAVEQPTPETAAHNPPAEPLATAASGNSGRPTQLAITVKPSVDVPVVAAEPPGKIDAATLSKLGFQSKEDAMTWLTGEGYAKSKQAFLALGVTDSSTVALLQPWQVKGLHGLKLAVRSKMVVILDKVVSDSDRLQMVFQQHHSWLEEDLGMEVAGM